MDRIEWKGGIADLDVQVEDGQISLCLCNDAFCDCAVEMPCTPSGSAIIVRLEVVKDECTPNTENNKSVARSADGSPDFAARIG